jgi:hypothetical protein
MQFRIIRVQSRNPLVGIVLLAAVLALFAFLLTAGLALAVGAAVLGGGVMAVRRLLGAKPPLVREPGDGRFVMLGEEVFPTVATDGDRSSRAPLDSPVERRLGPGDAP